MAHSDQPERRLYTIKEAAHLLNISTAGVYRLLGAKKVRGLKLGRTTRITADSIDEHIAGLAPYESRAAATTATAA